jgi:hypothetical protein
MKVIDPNDKSAIKATLAHAAGRQATESTDMNGKSSCLHAILTLNITAKHVEQNQVVRGITQPCGPSQIGTIG